MQLNPQQEAAANHLTGPCLVVAVPGSGKTRVLVERTVRLINSGIEPKNIISLTFTNKAAKEMKQRIATSLNHNHNNMFVGTFHALCAKILRQFGHYVDLPKNFTILDSGEQKDLINKIVRQKYEKFKKEMDADTIAEIINTAREDLVDLSQKDVWTNYFSKICLDSSMLPKFDDVSRTYLEYLKKFKCVDFSGLLYESIILMQKNDSPRNHIQNSHQYLQVDEAQDTNYAQFAIINLLSEKHKNVFVVGDPDQCVAEDSMVLTPNGLKKAISLNAGDSVLSGYGKGKLSEQKIIGKYVRKVVNKKMVKIITETGKTLTVTQNHSCFADYTEDYKDKLYFTYLMYKSGFGFRVGVTNNSRSVGYEVKGMGYGGKGGRGFCARLRQERADKMWLLKASKNREDVVFWEQLFSIKYGLPTWTYRPSLSGAYSKNMDEYSKKIFNEIDTETNAKKLLKNLGLFFDAPHFIPKCTFRNRRNFTITLCGDSRNSRGDPSHRWAMSGSEESDKNKIESLGFKTKYAKRNKGWAIGNSSVSLFKIRKIAQRISKHVPLNIIEQARLTNCSLRLLPASHILPHMTMFIYDEKNKKIVHDIVKSVEIINYSGKIVDFDVDKCHNFIANGIATHNSIYAFRGARYENIDDFINENKNIKIIKLTYNYRSTPQIVKVSDNLIKKNKKRIDKVFETLNQDGHPVKYNEFLDPDQEATFIANKITGLLATSSCSPNAFVVLYRTNFMSRILEETCVRMGIAYKIVGGFSFYERAEIKDCLAMLKLFANDRDVVAFSRVANLLDGIGPKTIQIIEEEFHKGEIGFVNVCQKVYNKLSRRSQASVDLLKQAYNCQHKEASYILAHIINSMHYEGILENSNRKDIDEKIENIYEFVNSLNTKENKNLSCDEVLQKISLYTSADEDSNKNQITLMTMHAAKGLEFPVVFVVGVEKDILPHIRSTEDLDGEEEERRLFYVAMTRSEKMLFVSSCRRRKIGGYGDNYRVCHPSPFLKEAGLVK